MCLRYMQDRFRYACTISLLAPRNDIGALIDIKSIVHTRVCIGKCDNEEGWRNRMEYVLTNLTKPHISDKNFLSTL